MNHPHTCTLTYTNTTYTHTYTTHTHTHTQVVQALALQGTARSLKRQLNIRYWDNYVKEMDGNLGTVVKQIKRNVKILMQFYGQKRSDLLAYSSGGEKFSNEVIIRSYRALLLRIEGGLLKVGNPTDLIGALMSDTHVFRGGTLTKDAKKLATKTKNKYLDMIKECEDEAAKLAARNALSKQRKTSRKGDKDPYKFVGRKVLIPSDHWDQAGNMITLSVCCLPCLIVHMRTYLSVCVTALIGMWYSGLITKYTSYRKGPRRVNGYEILFNDGGKEIWDPEDIIQYLVHGCLTAADIGS